MVKISLPPNKMESLSNKKKQVLMLCLLKDRVAKAQDELVWQHQFNRHKAQTDCQTKKHQFY